VCVRARACVCVCVCVCVYVYIYIYSNLMNEFREMEGLLYLNVRETPPTTKCTWPNVRINLGFHSKVKVRLFDLLMLHKKCDNGFTEHIASKQKVTESYVYRSVHHCDS